MGAMAKLLKAATASTGTKVGNPDKVRTGRAVRALARLARALRQQA